MGTLKNRLGKLWDSATKAFSDIKDEILGKPVMPESTPEPTSATPSEPATEETASASISPTTILGQAMAAALHNATSARAAYAVMAGASLSDEQLEKQVSDPSLLFKLKALNAMNPLSTDAELIAGTRKVIATEALELSRSAAGFFYSYMQANADAGNPASNEGAVGFVHTLENRLIPYFQNEIDGVAHTDTAPAAATPAEEPAPAPADIPAPIIPAAATAEATPEPASATPSEPAPIAEPTAATPTAEEPTPIAPVEEGLVIKTAKQPKPTESFKGDKDFFIKPFGENKLLSDERGLYVIGSPLNPPKKNALGETLFEENAGNAIEHVHLYLSPSLNEDGMNRAQTIANLLAAQNNYTTLFVEQDPADPRTYFVNYAGEPLSARDKTVQFADEKGMKKIEYPNNVFAAAWKHLYLVTDREISKTYAGYMRAGAAETEALLEASNTHQIFANKTQDGILNELFKEIYGTDEKGEIKPEAYTDIARYYRDNVKGKSFAELIQGKFPEGVSVEVPQLDEKGKPVLVDGVAQKTTITSFAHNILSSNAAQIPEELRAAMKADKRLLLSVAATRAIQRSVADHAIDSVMNLGADAKGEPLSLGEQEVDHIYDLSDGLGNKLFHRNPDGSMAGAFSPKRLKTLTLEHAQMASHRMIGQLASLSNPNMFRLGLLDDTDKKIVAEIRDPSEFPEGADLPAEKFLPKSPTRYLQKRIDILEDITVTDPSEIASRVNDGKPTSVGVVVENVNNARLSSGINAFGTSAPVAESGAWKATLVALGLVIDEAFNNFLKNMEEIPLMI